MSRLDSKLDAKKQFFLWFAGVRGAMSLALSIKCKFDFPEAGPVFLVLTLIIITFTLLYSTLFLEKTLKKCDIIIEDSLENIKEEDNKKTNCFTSLKTKLDELNQYYLIPHIKRECNYETESSQINQKREIQNKPPNAENIKINGPNEEDKSGNLVMMRKRDYLMDNSKNIEIHNDSD